jgi:hypothetical protein
LLCIHVIRMKCLTFFLTITESSIRRLCVDFLCKVFQLSECPSGAKHFSFIGKVGLVVKVRVCARARACVRARAREEINTHTKVLYIYTHTVIDYLETYHKSMILDENLRS